MILKNRKCSLTLLLAVAMLLGSGLLCARTRPDNLEIQKKLSGKIELKTFNQTFTHKFEFKILDGKIWSRSKTAGAEFPAWELLNGHGLPGKNKDDSPYADVAFIKEISADGDNLIAVDDKNIVYYTKTFNWKWNDHFSVIPFTRQLKLPADKRAFGIAHRGSFMKFYNDIDGNAHSIGAGVTTLYLLAANGHTIYFADPWLPPEFSHVVDTPCKGTFIAENMAVSGSTIFLINKSGEMYTRLYDYDTSGQNPVLAYSYQREKRQETSRGSVRSLPPEDWRKQPEIDGEITSSITIFQAGQGNSSFELRVEGKDAAGKTGYYSKAIYGDSWTFACTGLPLTGKLVDQSKTSGLYASPKVEKFHGIAWRGNDKIEAELEDFWPYSPPAKICFKVNGQKYQAKLHMRKYHKKKNGKLACAATIELGEDFYANKTADEVRLLESLFKKNTLLDLVLVIDKSGVSGAEDLHIIGLAETADTIISLMNKNGIKGELKASFAKRLRLKFTRNQLLK